jgi:glutathione gamma-glutamylcysteinyltransferase
VTEADFRAVVVAMSARSDAFLVCSYNRAVLRQTGTGHFSPIAGYHAPSDHVLVPRFASADAHAPGS